MEYLVNTQPHARNGTFRIIVRDLQKNVIVNQLAGGQVQKPQTLQVLDNGSLVVGYSKVRPWRFDFMNQEGELFNTVESDSDKCYVLRNGLVVEVMGVSERSKQTVVKQVLPEFKTPRIVQVYDFAVQWIDLFDTDILVAQKDAQLYVLSLLTSQPEIVLPMNLVALQLENQTLMGSTPQGDYVQRVHLQNLIQNGFTRTETVPIQVKRYKHNDIKLIPINARYSLYMNHQKHSVRDVGSSVYYLVDWQKRQTIWHTSQDISVVATSSDGLLVYCDNDTCSYHLLVCGSSLAVPIPLLSGLKPKGQSQFTSTGMFVFHGEKKIVVMDIETSTVHQQFDVTRHVCDLMALSRWNYKPRPKPQEVCIDIDCDTKAEGEELQSMINAKSMDVDTKVDAWIPPPPPPLPEPIPDAPALKPEPTWIPPPPPLPLPDVVVQVESKATQTEEAKTKPEESKVEEPVKVERSEKAEVIAVVPPKEEVKATEPKPTEAPKVDPAAASGASSCSIM